MGTDRAVDRSESARDGEAAYEAVMCWEWEGGALAPAPTGRAVRRPRPRDERRRGRVPDHSRRPRLGDVTE
jgi:hypothetical protein